MLSSLSELEFIRNKLAHNRRATAHDGEVAKITYMKILEAIGEAKFKALVSKCTCASDIPEALSRLQEEAKRLLGLCLTCKTLERLNLWRSIETSWWFTDSYLGHKIDSIREYFMTLESYSQLPRTRGSGHHIELWIKRHNVQFKYDDAQKQFASLLSKINWGKHGNQHIT